MSYMKNKLMELEERAEYIVDDIPEDPDLIRIVIELLQQKLEKLS